MHCPTCDARIYCIETRQFVKTVMQRKYRCTHCAKIFVTQERFADRWIPPTEMIAQEKRKARSRREDND